MNGLRVNPYLPSWEYVPDGEPHVFGDRIYVYGSHDGFGDDDYCPNDYVCYSASVDDLSDWKYEGVIFKKSDDPSNPSGELRLFAPDVAQGPDGRYYLYYQLNGNPHLSVAVCDTPAGAYSFYGYVTHSDGVLLGDKPGDLCFDPGVLVEGNKAYLYTGFAWTVLKECDGPSVAVLDADMKTIIEPQKNILPARYNSIGTDFEGHAFFEASSMRKVGDKYVFIYSSHNFCELCYAVSDSPVEGFKYGGVIVSNADTGIDTYKMPERQMNKIDNNHGSIEKIGDDWYIFYHRHTNNTGNDRQGCFEKITIEPGCVIPQVEITTSCGIDKPLPGKGTYQCYLACHYYNNLDYGKIPCASQDGKDGEECDGFVKSMTDLAGIGFKYFDFKGSKITGLMTRGDAKGDVVVKTSYRGAEIGRIPVGASAEFAPVAADVAIPDGVGALYLEFQGEGELSILSFTLG